MNVNEDIDDREIYNLEYCEDISGKPFISNFSIPAIHIVKTFIEM